MEKNYGLTHFNDAGEAHMVDVSDKVVTHRVAIAEGYITMQPKTLAAIIAGDHKKGDVLGIARVAGIMAAKKASELIPLCHPLPLTKVSVELDTRTKMNAVYCCVTAETKHVTGVEMEALTAVQISLLTIYDMCKAVDKGMCITDVCLVKKTGGKSGAWERDDTIV